MSISQYELKQLAKIGAAVAAGKSAQHVFDQRLTAVLLSNLSNGRTDAYDALLHKHGYTWISGKDPLDDTHADMNHADTLVDSDWQPIEISAALTAICRDRWPALFDVSIVDINAIRAAAEAM